MLNRVSIMGRITATPNYRRTSADNPVVSFRLAVERDYKSKETGKRPVDFFNVTAWRGLADFVVNYFCKGDMIVVDGRLELSDWTDEDGSRHQSVVIVAENAYFPGTKRNAVEQSDGTMMPMPQQTDYPPENMGEEAPKP